MRSVTHGLSALLIVDDDAGALAGLRMALEFYFREVRIDSARSVDEAITKIAQSAYAVVLTDLRMPGARAWISSGTYAGPVRECPCS